MSSIVRGELEAFIEAEQATIVRLLREAIAEAVERRDYEMCSKLDELLGLLRTSAPPKSMFASPMEYVDSLRSYAFIVSVVGELLRESKPTLDIARVSMRLLSLAREGLPIGKIAGDVKQTLRGLGDIGDMAFVGGCRKYINVLIGKVKELDPQELHIIKEAIGEILGEDRPFSTFSNMAKTLGTRERDLARILRRIAEKDPNIILTKTFIAFKDRMKKYLERRIAESKYLLINDLAREWGVGPREVREILKYVTEIYPGLMVFDGGVVSTIRDLAELIMSTVEESIVVTSRIIAAKLGVDYKHIRKILDRISGQIPEIILVDTEILAYREKISEWFDVLVNDRPRVFLEEVAGRLGVSNRDARKLMDILSSMRGDIVVVENEVLVMSKLADMLLEEMRTGQRRSDMADVLRRHSREIEERVLFESIGKMLRLFEEKIMGA